MLEFRCHAPGGVSYGFPLLYTQTLEGGEAAASLAQLGLQTRKVVAFVSWLLGDPGLCNSHTCVPGAFPPTLLGPPSEGKYSSITFDKRKIQDLGAKTTSGSMGHLQVLGVLADSCSSLFTTVRWQPRVVRLCFPKQIPSPLTLYPLPPLPT